MWKLSIKQDEKLVQVHDLPEQGLTIGRSTGCQVQIKNKRVSGQHARVYLENGTCYIQDLDSTNGTYLNARLIQCEPFRSSDQVEVAGYYLAVSEVRQQSDSVAEPEALEQTRYHSAAVVEEALVGGLVPIVQKKQATDALLSHSLSC